MDEILNCLMCGSNEVWRNPMLMAAAIILNADNAILGTFNAVNILALVSLRISGFNPVFSKVSGSESNLGMANIVIQAAKTSTDPMTTKGRVYPPTS